MRIIAKYTITIIIITTAICSLIFSAGCNSNSGENPADTISPPQTVFSTPVTTTPVPSAGESQFDVSETPPKSEDWMLVLVNPRNKLLDDFNISLTELVNGQSVDERCYPDLQQMIDDCRAEGLQPVICSSYRSHEKQQSLFDDKVARLKAQGYSDVEAQTEAAAVVALPGTSEHQLGLAVDVVDVENQNLDETQENTAVQQWLFRNSWKYGFILRYPSDKSDITGISYEPWHYRYVGKVAAKEIYDSGICLEEYLQGP